MEFDGVPELHDAHPVVLHEAQLDGQEIQDPLEYVNIGEAHEIAQAPELDKVYPVGHEVQTVDVEQVEQVDWQETHDDPELEAAYPDGQEQTPPDKENPEAHEVATEADEQVKAPVEH